MKNNKGVTLVELLVVIVVMGIIAGFAIPAVGGIIDNANRDAVLNDAIQVENAARLYCSTTQCEDLDPDTAVEYYELTWAQIGEYIDGMDGQYTETTGSAVAVIGDGTNWAVKLTNNSDGDYILPAFAASGAYTIQGQGALTGATVPATEFWIIPSEASRTDLTQS